MGLQINPSQIRQMLLAARKQQEEMKAREEAKKAAEEENVKQGPEKSTTSEGPKVPQLKNLHTMSIKEFMDAQRMLHINFDNADITDTWIDTNPNVSGDKGDGNELKDSYTIYPESRLISMGFTPNELNYYFQKLNNRKKDKWAEPVIF